MKSQLWESEKTMFLKALNTPAIEKLRWLEEFRRFVSLLPKKTLAIREKLKESR